MIYKCITKCKELDVNNSPHCVSDDNSKDCPVWSAPMWVNQEDIISVDLDRGVQDEIDDSIKQLYELFMVASDLNQSENTRTAFSQKTTTYLSNIIQTLQYIDGQLGG